MHPVFSHKSHIMATLKLTIDGKRSYSDGRVPIIFRLTHNTKSTRIEAGVKIYKQEWDTVKRRINRTHPEYKQLNLMLGKRLLELEKMLLEVSFSRVNPNIKQLKEILLNGNKSAKVLFSDFAFKEIANLRSQDRYGNAQAYETATNRLIAFAGKEITLDRINYTLISDFDNYLLNEGISKNTVAVYMREIRALLNKAIKKQLVDRNLYPFNDYSIKTEKTISRAITKQDIQKIEEIELQVGTELWHSRNIFFLIFNLIGISFIDLALLKQSSIQGERIIYKRRKGGKIYSIKMNEEVKRILGIYKKNDSKYLVSHFRLDDIPKNKEREEIALRLQTCNKFLKKIGKTLELPITLTTYVARYSWANIAKSLGYPKDQIAEALGHSYGNQITGIYLDNYGSEVIDEMNGKVTEN